MTRSPADRLLSFRTWPIGLVLLAACTAPPRAEPPPPPPPAALPTIHVTLTAPGLSPETLQAEAVAVVEQAIAPLPEIDAVVSRTDEGRATIAALVTDPDATRALRDALNSVVPRLPRSVDPPTLSRADVGVPVLALRVGDDPGAVSALVERLERTPGVGRVDLCGGHERAILIDLAHRRSAGVPIDKVADAVRTRIHAPDADARRFELRAPGPPADLAEWPATAIPGTSLTLRDVAVLSDRGRPRPCLALLDDAPQVTVLVHAQPGADPRRVTADVRAAVPGAGLEAVVTLGEARDAGLAILELELPPSAVLSDLERCLHDTAGARSWALVRPGGPRPGAPSHLRLWLSPPAEPGARAIGHVREDLSKCAGIPEIAVLAPDADADHPASLELLGPDPAALADLADAAAARLRELPGVTLLRVHASRPRPVRELTLDRAALAAHGVPEHALSVPLRLAVGPLELGRSGGVPVLLDMPDRPDDLDGALRALSVSSPGGPLPLTALMTVADGPPTRTPLYRVAQSNAAAVELRLRRAADREAVLAAVQDLELPAGVQLRLGREFPPLGP